jgi:hypothetical protein
MAISYSETTVVIDGECGVEEAMPMLEFLQGHATARIDLRACTNLHSASLQVVMAVADRIASLPEEKFLSRWLTPLFGADPVTSHAEPGGEAPAQSAKMKVS